ACHSPFMLITIRRYALPSRQPAAHDHACDRRTAKAVTSLQPLPLARDVPDECKRPPCEKVVVDHSPLDNNMTSIILYMSRQCPRWEGNVFERMQRRFGDRVEKRIVATGFDRVKYIAPVRPEAATGLVAAVYEQVARDFQLLAPITLTSPLPALLAARWTVTRETLIAGAAPRLEKEL